LYGLFPVFTGPEEEEREQPKRCEIKGFHKRAALGVIGKEKRASGFCSNLFVKIKIIFYFF
jgi:hypothetical protein